MLSGSNLLTAVNTFIALLAVIIAARALRHNRNQSSKDDTTETVRNDTTAQVRLDELTRQYDRMADLIQKLTQELMDHQKECIRDKTILSENLRVTTDNMVTISGRLDSWAQQVSFLAQEKARRETAQALGQAPR